MDKQKQIPENLKEKRASHSFVVTIRDKSHFNAIVKWMNTNVGRGKERWTAGGRILRQLQAGKKVNATFYVFDPAFDVASALYLNLI